MLKESFRGAYVLNSPAGCCVGSDARARPKMLDRAYNMRSKPFCPFRSPQVFL